VHLTNDTHFDLYDTSGPQVIVIFVLYGNHMEEIV
jgi:hypothetical protein